MRSPQFFTVDGTGVTQVTDADGPADVLDSQPSIETAGADERLGPHYQLR